MCDHRNDHAVPAERQRSMQRSMHDGVPVWCDCCSCEAEPYWSAPETTPADVGAARKSAPVRTADAD